MDFMNFLSSKYIQKPSNNSIDEISPEMKGLLMNRIEAHKLNPQDAVAWEEIEEQFEEKYGYDI